LELKCKNYERTKKIEKKTSSRPDQTRPSRPPTHVAPERRINANARPCPQQDRATTMLTRPTETRGPFFPFSFISFRFSEPISIQTRISQVIQLLFWIRLFLHIPLETLTPPAIYPSIYIPHLHRSKLLSLKSRNLNLNFRASKFRYLPSASKRKL
jgi:hypothetical protein